jgi:hypothetical protein
MATRMPVAVLLGILLFAGCHSRDFIARNATQQTATVNDMLQQQVLDNPSRVCKEQRRVAFFDSGWRRQCRGYRYDWRLPHLDNQYCGITRWYFGGKPVSGGHRRLEA